MHLKVLGVQVERQAWVPEQRIEESALQMHVKRIPKLVGFGLTGRGPGMSMTGGSMVPLPTPAPRVKDIVQGSSTNLADALGRQPQTIGCAPYEAGLVQECFELLQLLLLRRRLWQGLCGRGWGFLVLLWSDIL
jgi:hypothetical protein